MHTRNKVTESKVCKVESVVVKSFASCRSKGLKFKSNSQKAPVHFQTFTNFGFLSAHGKCNTGLAVVERRRKKIKKEVIKFCDKKKRDFQIYLQSYLIYTQIYILSHWAYQINMDFSMNTIYARLVNVNLYWSQEGTLCMYSSDIFNNHDHRICLRMGIVFSFFQSQSQPQCSLQGYLVDKALEKLLGWI